MVLYLLIFIVIDLLDLVISASILHLDCYIMKYICTVIKDYGFLPNTTPPALNPPHMFMPSPYGIIKHYQDIVGHISQEQQQ